MAHVLFLKYGERLSQKLIYNEYTLVGTLSGDNEMNGSVLKAFGEMESGKKGDIDSCSERASLRDLTAPVTSLESRENRIAIGHI